MDSLVAGLWVARLQRSLSHDGAALLLFAIALAFYLPGVDDRPYIVGDERHYVDAARRMGNADYFAYLRPTMDEQPARTPLPVNPEHPMLAKTMIWGGMEIFGNNPWGWRISSVLAGAAAVAATFLLAKRLFGSALAGWIAASLLGFDTMWRLTSTTAMLDAPCAAFLLGSFALLFGPRTNAFASSVLYGLAVACKPSALFLGPVYAVAQFHLPKPGRKIVHVAVVSLLIPGAVLIATYLPFFALSLRIDGWPAVANLPAALSYPYIYHAPGQALGSWASDESSPPWSWWVSAAPLVSVGHVVRANLWLWWPALVLTLTPLGIRDRSSALAAAMSGASFLPYFLLDRPTFLHWMAMSIPFFGVVVGGAASWALTRRRLRVSLRTSHLEALGDYTEKATAP